MSLIVKKITVEKLFGKFNYDLNLDNGYDASILIAPNGCGKTTILNFLSFILNPTTEAFAKICDIPFVKYSCVLSNNDYLELSKERLDDERIYMSAGQYNVFIDKDNIAKFVSLWDGLKFIFTQYPDTIKNFQLVGYEVKGGESLAILYKEYERILLKPRPANRFVTRKDIKQSKYDDIAIRVDQLIKKNQENVEISRSCLENLEKESKELYNQYSHAVDMLNSQGLSDAEKPALADKVLFLREKYNNISKEAESARIKLAMLEDERLSLEAQLSEMLEKCSRDTRKIIMEREEKTKIKSAREFFKSYYKTIKGLRINFIQANRLFTVNNEEAITIINKDIKIRFNTISEEYNKKLSAATDNVVVQFVNPNDDSQKLIKTKPSYKTVKKNWDKYVNEVTRLSMANLIDSKSKFIYLFDNIKPEDEKMVLFMQLCTEEFNKTLEPFRDFYKRLDRFTRILNERNIITEKVLSFSKDEGFTLKTWDGRPLRLERMSSGEKNDFVMFYNLIFNSEYGDLVLIDEPEISLHIRWQKGFMSTILDICRMNKLQAFVATHSPHIINGYLDLLVEGGPANEQ